MKQGALFGKVMKVFFFFIFLFGLLLLGLGYYLTQEIQEFQQNWVMKEKVLLLTEDDTIHIGIAGTFRAGEEPHVLTTSEKEKISQGLREQDQALLLRNYYLAVFFTPEAFSSVEGGVTYAGITLPIDEVRKLLRSPQPKDQLGTLLGERGKRLPAVSDDQLKGLLFGLLFEEGVRQDPFFLLAQYRKGTITIIPETFLFSIFKKAPQQFYEQVKTRVNIGEKHVESVS